MRYVVETNQVEFDSSNPNGVVSAPIGTLFYRNGKTYYTSFRGTLKRVDIPSRSFGMENIYRIWFPTIREKDITFSHPQELWYKSKDSGKRSRNKSGRI